jgi:hypothetical protein
MTEHEKDWLKRIVTAPLSHHAMRVNYTLCPFEDAA